MKLASHLSFFVIFSLFFFESLFSETQISSVQEIRPKYCLLPKKHPLQARLKNLFKDPDMFQSPEHLNLAGFHVVNINKVRRGFMVASHPTIKKYLIKKFQCDTPRKEEVRNYLQRIEGARALREFIKLNKLQHIVVPRKWLYRLPIQFSDPEKGKKSYVLIAEKIDICSGGKDVDGEIAKRYQDIDFDVLRELCIVVYYFRGLDSGLQNMPFTYQNQIAFIDTEHWEQNRYEFLRYVMPHLSQDRQEYVLAVFEELKAQDNR